MNRQRATDLNWLFEKKDPPTGYDQVVEDEKARADAVFEIVSLSRMRLYQNHPPPAEATRVQKSTTQRNVNAFPDHQEEADEDRLTRSGKSLPDSSLACTSASMLITYRCLRWSYHGVHSINIRGGVHWKEDTFTTVARRRIIDRPSHRPHTRYQALSQPIVSIHVHRNISARASMEADSD